MATIRKHVHIGKPADEVWKVVSDAGTIHEWFPAVQGSKVDGSTRTVELDGGVEFTEDLITNDDELRRFQYRITEGLPAEFHLGTIDVLPDGDGCLVIYSTDVQPDELGSLLEGALADAVQGLKDYCEK